MHETLEIAPRFCGPPGSANGGHVAGLLAARAAVGRSAVTVRLHRPLPLATPLLVHAASGGGVELVHEGTTLATAERGRLAGRRPRLTTFGTAARLSRSFAGFRHHPFPRCFVCGPERGEGDGLRIFPGPWYEGEVAAPWQPHASLDAGDGTVRPEHVWAALDCPGYFAAVEDGRPMLLGQMTAWLGRAPRIGEACVALGWRLEALGRRHRVGTAILGADGALCGLAEAIWVEPRPSHPVMQSAALSGASSRTGNASVAA